MRFTREHIRNMDEATLRIEVLKPLFEKMGFRDVFHHHGGIGEKGKDFVMWKPGDLGERINYAVVAKVERITGKADTRPGSAGGVAVQIRQAFGQNFLDHVTTEEQRVNICWVVTSKEISKEAEESIKAELTASNLDRFVRFVDGDHLWKMVQEKFPECAAFEHLRCANNIFENLDTDWRVSVSTHGGKNDFHIEPKHPEAEARPLEFKFKFTNDAGGQAKSEEVQAALEKGTPVVIEAAYLSSVVIPDFLGSLFGPVDKLEFQPNLQTISVPVCLRVDSDDGSKLCVDYLVLRVERAGSKETLLSNLHQGFPWTFTILLDRAKRLATPEYHIKFESGNAHQLLQTMQLWQALAKPGTAIMEIAETGIAFLKWRTESAVPKPELPDPWLLSLFEDLDFIQRATSTQIYLRRGAIGAEAVAHAQHVARCLRVGRYKAKRLKLSLTYDRSTAERLLRADEDNRGSPLTVCGTNQVENVLGQDVPLGPVALHLSNARLSDACVSELRSALQRSGQGQFTLTFESVDDSPAELFYLNSLPRDAELPPEVRHLVNQGIPEKLRQMGEEKA